MSFNQPLFNLIEPETGYDKDKKLGYIEYAAEYCDYNEFYKRAGLGDTQLDGDGLSETRVFSSFSDVKEQYPDAYCNVYIKVYEDKQVEYSINLVDGFTDKNGKEPYKDVCLTDNEQKIFYEAVCQDLERTGESISDHLELAKEARLENMEEKDMEDNIYKAVKDLLNLNNDMGFHLGGDYDDILLYLKEDPRDTINSLNENRFFIDTDSLIAGILFSNEESTLSCENFTMRNISENAADLKEDILNALSIISEVYDVSSTIEYIDKAFDRNLEYQAYAQCIGLSYWMLLDEADVGMDFDVKTNDSYTVGSIDSYIYPDCLYELHASLNPQKYEHISINAAMYRDKTVFYANKENYTNNCRDISKDERITNPTVLGVIRTEFPAIRNAKIFTEVMIKHLNENKSQIKQVAQGKRRDTLDR